MSLCSLHVGENKTTSEHVQDYHHLHGDCLLHLLFSLPATMSLCVWIICVGSVAPTNSYFVPAIKTEFWKEVIKLVDCSSPYLSLLQSAHRICNNAPSAFPPSNSSARWPGHIETRQIMTGQKSISTRLSFLISCSHRGLEVKGSMYLKKDTCRRYKTQRRNPPLCFSS